MVLDCLQSCWGLLGLVISRNNRKLLKSPESVKSYHQQSNVVSVLHDADLSFYSKRRENLRLDK